MSEITLPRKIVISRGGLVTSLLETFRSLDSSNVLVIADERVKFLVKGLRDSFLNEGMVNEVVVLSPGHVPTLGEIEDITNLGRKIRADVVVGIGGSHAVFASKLVSTLLKRPLRDLDSIRPTTFISSEFERPYLVIAPLCGCWGGGSLGAVAYRRDNKVKVLINKAFIPHSILLDPTISPSLTIRTVREIVGDALTYSIESYLCPLSNELVRALSLHAIKLLFTYAPQALRDLTDLEAWEKLQLASVISSIGASRYSIPFTSLISLNMSVSLNVPSGLISGVLLPNSIRMYRELSRDIDEELKTLKGVLEQDLGLERRDDLLDHLNVLYSKMGFPRSVRELKVEEEKYNDVMSNVLERISEEFYSLSVGPVRPSLEHIIDLLKSSY